MNEKYYEIVSLGYEAAKMPSRQELLGKLDKIAGICYGRQMHLSEEVQSKFLCKLEKAGHHTIFEHESVTVKFICDRALANCITRHRLMSFTQESTMYKTYKDKIKIVLPSYILRHIGFTMAGLWWKESVNASCRSYFDMVTNGIPQRVARAVLPLCTAVELYATANLREWRHFFEMRCSMKDHDDMRLLVYPLFTVFEKVLPEYFSPLRGVKGFYNGPEDE